MSLKKFDAGDIVLQSATSISNNEFYQHLEQRLVGMGQRMILDVLKHYPDYYVRCLLIRLGMILGRKNENNKMQNK